MATIISSAVSTSSSSSTTVASTSQSRITQAQKLSVTPNSQADLAVILSLSGQDTTPTDPGLGSLIYSSSVAIAGTSAESFLTGGTEEEQVEAIIKAFTK